jgi:hypothetical protein
MGNSSPWNSEDRLDFREGLCGDKIDCSPLEGRESLRQLIGYLSLFGCAFGYIWWKENVKENDKENDKVGQDENVQA